MHKNIAVTVLGRDYPLRVAEEHEPFTRRVAALVDERAREEAERAPGHPPLTYVTFAALRLGEEMLVLRERIEAAENLERDAALLAERLEQALDAGGEADEAAPPKKRRAKAASPSRPAAPRKSTHGTGEAPAETSSDEEHPETSA